MHLEVHTPMFGSKNIEGKPTECPVCPRGLSLGANDWEDKDISVCNPGDTFKCNRCGTVVTVNWGLVEPDHLSTWKNSECCPHRLCQRKREDLHAIEDEATQVPSFSNLA